MADTDLVRSDRIASHLATGYAFGRRGREGRPGSRLDRRRSRRDLLDDPRHGPLRRGAARRWRQRARARAPARDAGDDVRAPLPAGCAAARAWASASSAPRPPATGSSSTTGSCRASTPSCWSAPDDGIGVIGFTNGSSGAFAWLSTELGRLLRDLLGLPQDAVRSDIPHHPEVWAELCGRYVFPPRIADLRQRLMLGLGAEVFVRGGRLDDAAPDASPRALPRAPAPARRRRRIPTCSGSTCRSSGWRRSGSCSAAIVGGRAAASTPIWVVSRGR